MESGKLMEQSDDIDKNGTQFHESCCSGVLALFDKDGDGEIDCNELSEVFKSFGYKMRKSEIEDIIAQADLDGNKKINVIELRKIALHCIAENDCETSMHDAFSLMDCDKDGILNANDIKRTALHMGQEITFEDAEAMIADELGENNSGAGITFEQFCDAVRSQ